jgi:hypothetical protein
MLYNQVGGKFLNESLKGFEILIESLGKEIRESTGFDKDASGAKGNGIGRRARWQKLHAAERLERLHDELMKESLSQLRSVDLTHGTSETPQSPADLRSKLEESLEPVKLLHSSLKNLEPMLESLNKELAERIQETSLLIEEDYTLDTSSSAEMTAAKGSQSPDMERPSDPGVLEDSLPHSPRENL